MDITSNDIIKAFACCDLRQYSLCSDCPCYINSKCVVANHEYELEEKVLDLLNRQKTEIERLEKENETFAKRFYKEGIKDFARKLKEKSWKDLWDTVAHVDVDDIDNLAKEMVGDT